MALIGTPYVVINQNSQYSQNDHNETVQKVLHVLAPAISVMDFSILDYSTKEIVEVDGVRYTKSNSNTKYPDGILAYHTINHTSISLFFVQKKIVEITVTDVYNVELSAIFGDEKVLINGKLYDRMNFESMAFQMSTTHAPRLRSDQGCIVLTQLIYETISESLACTR